MEGSGYFLGRPGLLLFFPATLSGVGTLFCCPRLLESPCKPASLLSVHAGASLLHDLSPPPGFLPANPLLRPLPPVALAADVNRLVCVGDGDVLYRCDSCTSSPSSSSPSDAISRPARCSPVKPRQPGFDFPNPVPPRAPNFVQFWPRPPQPPPKEDRWEEPSPREVRDVCLYLSAEEDDDVAAAAEEKESFPFSHSQGDSLDSILPTPLAPFLPPSPWPKMNPDLGFELANPSLSIPSSSSSSCKSSSSSMSRSQCL